MSGLWGLVGMKSGEMIFASLCRCYFGINRDCKECGASRGPNRELRTESTRLQHDTLAWGGSRNIPFSQDVRASPTLLSPPSRTARWPMARSLSTRSRITTAIGPRDCDGREDVLRRHLAFLGIGRDTARKRRPARSPPR